MKCDLCEEKATVFYTQVAEGKLKKFVLCETCAQNKGITNPDGLLMAEQVLNQAVGGVEPEIFSPEANGECPSCGFSLNDYQKVGRLGCPDCYEALGFEIERRIPSLHKGAFHTGYVPAGLAASQALRSQISDIEEQLKGAIALENYEEAATLRDQLESLKAESCQEAATD